MKIPCGIILKLNLILDNQTKLKRKETLIGVSRENCTNIYLDTNIHIEAGHLCAGGTTGVIGPCRNDEGAPLIAFSESDPKEKYWYLAGLFSFGPSRDPCGKEGLPGVYTRVSFYYDWIISKLQ